MPGCSFPWLSTLVILVPYYYGFPLFSNLWRPHGLTLWQDPYGTCLEFIKQIHWLVLSLRWLVFTVVVPPTVHVALSSRSRPTTAAQHSPSFPSTQRTLALQSRVCCCCCCLLCWSCCLGWCWCCNCCRCWSCCHCCPCGLPLHRCAVNDSDIPPRGSCYVPVDWFRFLVLQHYFC
jgi:hypothetical protein